MPESIQPPSPEQIDPTLVMDPVDHVMDQNHPHGDQQVVSMDAATFGAIESHVLASRFTSAAIIQQELGLPPAVAASVIEEMQARGSVARSAPKGQNLAVVESRAPHVEQDVVHYSTGRTTKFGRAVVGPLVENSAEYANLWRHRTRTVAGVTSKSVKAITGEASREQARAAASEEQAWHDNRNYRLNIQEATPEPTQRLDVPTIQPQAAEAQAIPSRVERARSVFDELVAQSKAPSEAPATPTAAAERTPVEAKATSIPDVAELLKDESDDVQQAAELIITSQFASVSMLQRKLRISHQQAAQVMDRLEQAGIVASKEESGSKARNVLVKPQVSEPAAPRPAKTPEREAYEKLLDSFPNA